MKRYWWACKNHNHQQRHLYSVVVVVGRLSPIRFRHQHRLQCRRSRRRHHHRRRLFLCDMSKEFDTMMDGVWSRIWNKEKGLDLLTKLLPNTHTLIHTQPHTPSKTTRTQSRVLTQWTLSFELMHVKKYDSMLLLVNELDGWITVGRNSREKVTKPPF